MLLMPSPAPYLKNVTVPYLEITKASYMMCIISTFPGDLSLLYQELRITRLFSRE